VYIFGSVRLSHIGNFFAQVAEKGVLKKPLHWLCRNFRPSETVFPQPAAARDEQGSEA
jgi:hypothetical protein